MLDMMLARACMARTYGGQIAGDREGNGVRRGEEEVGLYSIGFVVFSCSCADEQT